MNIRIECCGGVDGSVRAPPSKSYTQRAVACALLADGCSEIVDPSRSEDGLAALGAARHLGANISESGRSWQIGGGEVKTPYDVIDCVGSATTLRLFTAISSLAQGSSVLTGNDSLRRRPIGELLCAMNLIGATSFSTRGNGMPPVVVMGGGIKGGEAQIRGDVSSQFVSALLFASTGASEETKVLLKTPLESRHYVEMSIELLRFFGAKIHNNADFSIFRVAGRQRLKPQRYCVEGDYSSASFMLAAGLLGGRAVVNNLDPASKQGDRAFLDVVAAMGGSISRKEDSIEVFKSDCLGSSKLRGISIDGKDTPDLVPILAAVATQAEGVTTISGIRRLRIKESDRAQTIIDVLRAMGADICSLGDTIVIKGKSKLKGTKVNTSSDHRIAMTAAVASLVAEGETIIQGAECVSKSYPSFFDDLRRLGVPIKAEAESDICAEVHAC